MSWRKWHNYMRFSTWVLYWNRWFYNLLRICTTMLSWNCNWIRGVCRTMIYWGIKRRWIGCLLSGIHRIFVTGRRFLWQVRSIAVITIWCCCRITQWCLLCDACGAFLKRIAFILRLLSSLFRCDSHLDKIAAWSRLEHNILCLNLLNCLGRSLLCMIMIIVIIILIVLFDQRDDCRIWIATIDRLDLWAAVCRDSCYSLRLSYLCASCSVAIRKWTSWRLSGCCSFTFISCTDYLDFTSRTFLTIRRL